MRAALLTLLVFLTACASTPVPVKKEFPDPVPELMEKCQELLKIEGDNVAITEMLKVVVKNYSLYYQCSVKVDGWQEWYKRQKEIYDSVK